MSDYKLRRKLARMRSTTLRNETMSMIYQYFEQCNDHNIEIPITIRSIWGTYSYIIHEFFEKYPSWRQIIHDSIQYIVSHVEFKDDPNIDKVVYDNFAKIYHIFGLMYDLNSWKGLSLDENIPTVDGTIERIRRFIDAHYIYIDQQYSWAESDNERNYIVLITKIAKRTRLAKYILADLQEPINALKCMRGGLICNPKIIDETFLELNKYFDAIDVILQSKNNKR